MAQFLPEGSDLDWYAMDSVGMFGYFTSGGSALIPKVSLRSLKQLVDIHKFFLSLPVITECRMVAERHGKMQSWHQMAMRGLYTYDYDMNTDGPYRVIATPIIPLRANMIDREIIAFLPHFSEVAFQNALELSYIPGAE